MKNIQTISNLKHNINTKDQIINNRDLLNIKGGQSEPPPFGVEV